MTGSFFDCCKPVSPWYSRTTMCVALMAVLGVTAVQASAQTDQTDQSDQTTNQPTPKKHRHTKKTASDNNATVAKTVPVVIDRAVIAGIPEHIQMFVGDIKVFHLDKPIKTVAVGNGKVISGTTIDNGDLLLLGLDGGDTTVHVWGTNGQHYVTRIRVELKDMDRVNNEIAAAVGDTPGLTIKPVGDRILIEGQNIPPETSKIIDSIAKLYPQASNLTVPGAKKEFLQPMIQYDLQFIEISKSALQNIGVQWNASSTGGLNFGYFSDFILNGSAADGVARVGGGTAPTYVSGVGTYTPNNKVNNSISFNSILSFGSTVNLAITNGDAYVLAAPRLSARSGGKAKFLSGGEIPYQSTSATGTASINYKQYGITMNMEGSVVGANGITGSLVAEVSSIDESNVINGNPGFLTRRTESEFNMHDGETMVLSGLSDKENSRNTASVPLLGDIPILGELFHNKQFSGTNKELLVFITPHIYGANSDLNRQQIIHGVDNLNNTSTALGDGNIDNLANVNPMFVPSTVITPKPAAATQPTDVKTLDVSKPADTTNAVPSAENTTITPSQHETQP